MFIPFLDTLIANINSCFPGVVVQLVVTALVFHSALHPDDATLLKAYGNSKLSTLANVYGEKNRVTIDRVTYSPLAIINKEELLGEWQLFNRAVFHEKKFMMKKTHHPFILA